MKTNEIFFTHTHTHTHIYIYMHLFVSRSKRHDHDVRVHESRLKQYENDIAELKIRSNTVTSDLKRRIEENEVE